MQQGDTQIAAALQWQIGQTTTSTVQQGDVWVQVVDSSQAQRATGGTANYMALQSWMQRTLYDTLDLSQLSIRPGLGWRAAIVVHILHANGAVRDASWLAAVAVLRLGRIPIVTTDAWPLRDGKYLGLPANDVFDTKPFAMPVFVPICLTISQWQNANSNTNDNKQTSSTQWWVDATAAEQEAATGSLTLLVTPDGELHSVEFAGACNSTALITQHLPLLQRLAVERAVEVQAILPTSNAQE